jgi:hypothetical protein
MTEELIGYVGVDSGQMLLCDPCYIDSMWKKDDTPADFRDLSAFQGRFSYLGAAQATLSDKKAGILDMSVGAVCSTGWGDGLYPVYVSYEGSRISEMRIAFLPEKEECFYCCHIDCDGECQEDEDI